MRRAWADTLRTPGRTVLLALIDGDVVGALDVPVVADAARAGRPSMLVEDVVVDAAHRGHGVGRAVLEAAVRQARSEDCYEVQLSPGRAARLPLRRGGGDGGVSGRTYELYLDD